MSIKVKINKVIRKVQDKAADAISAPSRAISAVKAVNADIKRGKVLWKQGYGKSHEGLLSIAKKGKKAGKSRPAQAKKIPNSTRVGLKQVIKYKKK